MKPEITVGGYEMGATAKVLYTPEETAKMEIRYFINIGLRDVQNNDFYDFDEVFDELEKRYQSEDV
jgi:hypothetical protein